MRTDHPHNNRIWQYDALRILACFSVLMLHSAAQCWYGLPIDSTDWLIANTYDGLVRFGVPVFVMISGALFLAPDRKYSLRKLYTHNILRLAAAYVVWAFIYAVWSVKVLPTEEQSVSLFLDYLAEPRYHLWFIPMLVGIYMLLPLLRLIVIGDNAVDKSAKPDSRKRYVEYFMLLFFVFQILPQTLLAVTGNERIINLLEVLPIGMVQGYLGYFFLGYYLAHMTPGLACRRWIYGLGLAAIPAGALASNFLSRRAGRANTLIYDSYSIFTMLGAAALFLLFRQMGRREKRDAEGMRRTKREPWAVLRGILREVSDCTMGIYLMHLLVMELLFHITGFYSGSLPLFAGIPLLALVCFCISLAITMVLRRIPRVGKYIC